MSSPIRRFLLVAFPLFFFLQETIAIQEVAGLAKRTKKQAYDAWIEKQSEWHRKRQKDPHYQEIIKKSVSIRAAYSKAKNRLKNIRSHIPDGIPISASDPRIRELKIVEAQLEALRQEKVALKRQLIETYGPVDRDLENLSDEEWAIFNDFEPDLEPENDISPFHDSLVVEPVPWAWKDCFLSVRADFNKMSFLNKINWKAYLNDRGLVRFMIKTNSREVIRERLAAQLDILKDSGVVTSKRSGRPLVHVVGSLYPREERGAIVELNPSALKEKILEEVIKVLPGPFRRKDPLDPERMRARKLWREGKKPSEIAFKLHPKQSRAYKEKLKKEKTVKEANKKLDLTAITKKIDCPKHKECLDKAVKDNLSTPMTLLCGNCQNMEGVLPKQHATSGLKRKSRTNPLRIKVYRFLKS